MLDKTEGRNYKIKRSLGLKFKFSVGIIFLICIVMGSVGFVVHSRVHTALLSQMKIKGIALARGLAVNAGEALMTGDHLLLAELVDKATQQEKGISHAALVDAAGNVLTHSDFKQEGRHYKIPSNAETETLGESKLLYYSVQGEPCLDFSVPIRLESKTQKTVQHLGTAHLVYFLFPLETIVYGTLTDLLYITSGGLILGILFSLFLVNRITSPINTLARGAERIGKGDLDVHITLKRSDELGRLAFTFNQMTVNLKQAQKVLIEKERLQHEMEIAQTIQNMLVPKSAPVLEGYSVGMLYRSAKEVSGDYFDFIELNKGLWGMVVADVSGKGVPGGLVMAQLRSILRSIARENQLPSKVLSQTERQLSQDMCEDMFVTIAYMVLDPARRTVTLSRAGHPATIIYRRASRQCELEMPRGLAIGLATPELFEETLEEKQLQLGPGDCLFMYTDGVDEASNEKKELFGQERICQCLKKLAPLPAQEIIDGIDGKVSSFAAGFPQNDDMTMMVVKVEED